LCFHQAHTLPTMLISLPICFYAEFIIQIPGKCRLRNFYLVILKISTDKVTKYFKIYFYMYSIEWCLSTSWNWHSNPQYVLLCKISAVSRKLVHSRMALYLNAALFGCVRVYEKQPIFWLASWLLHCHTATVGKSCTCVQCLWTYNGMGLQIHE